jgi:putative addiction module component (TIGR02574 family)
MARSFQEVRAEALTLPDEERGQLADDLLDSLSATGDSPVSEAWIAEARRRLADLKSGRDIGLTREEFFADE